MEYNFSELHSILHEILGDLHDFCERNHITYWLSYGGALGAVRHGDFIPWDDDCDIVIPQEEYRRFYELACAQLSDKYVIESPLYNEKIYSPLMKVKKKGTTFINHYYLGNPETRHNIFIDVFPLYNVPDSKLSRKKQRFTEIIYNLVVRGEHANRKAVDSLIHFFVKLFGRKRVLKWTYNSFSKYKFEKCTQLECVNSAPYYGAELLDKNVYYPPKKMKFGEQVVYVPNDIEAYLTKLYGDYMQIPSEEQIAKAMHSIYIDTRHDYTEHMDLIEQYAKEYAQKEVVKQ